MDCRARRRAPSGVPVLCMKVVAVPMDLAVAGGEPCDQQPNSASSSGPGVDTRAELLRDARPFIGRCDLELLRSHTYDDAFSSSDVRSSARQDRATGPVKGDLDAGEAGLRGGLRHHTHDRALQLLAGGRGRGGRDRLRRWADASVLVAFGAGGAELTQACTSLQPRLRRSSTWRTEGKCQRE